MPDLPAGAVQAALSTGALGDPHLSDRARVRLLLEAAAPHLVAAEREKLAAWMEGPEARAVTASAIRSQVGQEIATAVAAERQRLLDEGWLPPRPPSVPPPPGLFTTTEGTP